MNFSSKEKRIHKTGQERAKQADYEEYIKTPSPQTWSARMPAYYKAGKDMETPKTQPGLIPGK